MNSVLPRPDPEDEPPRHPPGRDVTMIRGFLIVIMMAMLVATVTLGMVGGVTPAEAVLIAVAWGAIVGAYIMAGHLPGRRR